MHVGLRALGLLLLFGDLASAEPIQLRFATITPEGTAPARELQAFARDVDNASRGQVRIKWIFGGIAGDEFAALERVRRGQIDGVGGTISCSRLAPSLAITRLPGVFQSRREVLYALGAMRATLDAEFLHAGFIDLGEVALGPSIVFSRLPVRSFADLKRMRLWRWDLDDVGVETLRAMGLNLVPLPIEEAGRAFDQGQLDGFIGVPMGALAFQWSVRSSNVIDLRMDYLLGCVVIAARSFDRLTFDQQQQLRQAGAKLAVRISDVGAQGDAALLGGLFARQGLKTVAVPPELFAEFFNQARSARDRAGRGRVPPGSLEQIQSLLADFRAEHATQIDAR